MRNELFVAVTNYGMLNELRKPCMTLREAYVRAGWTEHVEALDSGNAERLVEALEKYQENHGKSK